MIRGIVVGALALLMGAIALAADIDDTRLLAAATDPASWLTYGRDYGNQRFSPLSGIDASNVTRLAPRWIYQSGVSATFQATPIVADGVMYVSLPFNDVVAVDARTGREQWRYQHQRRRPAMCCGPANRGVAVAYGLVYEATVDARLIALDQKTGRLVWEVPLVEDDPGVTEHSEQLAADDPVRGRRVMGSTGVSANMAPLVYKSRVIVGITGVGYGLHLDSDRPGAPVGTVIGIAGQSGRAGFYAAFGGKTGERLGKFEPTGGQAGKTGWFYVLDRRDGRLLYRSEAFVPQHNLFRRPAPGGVEIAPGAGGGASWSPVSYDPRTGLVYVAALHLPTRYTVKEI